MKKHFFLYLSSALIVFSSCSKKETAVEILEQTIRTIDTIETVHYKQDMWRSDPRDVNDTIFRFREMYLQRLIIDSVVGAKGHWYMYSDDRINVNYEDIYDGEKLIRKNNLDSVARIYDLNEYPGFKQKHFWGHNTIYGMQFEFRYMLDNKGFYSIERLDDTIIDNTSCYQILVTLENEITMPGFAIKLENNPGSVSETSYFIDKKTFYPVGMKGEYYSSDNPGQKTYLVQKYYDIELNLAIDEQVQFNTSVGTIIGFEKVEMKPE